MSAAVCPYCRGPIALEEGNELLCAGCGTPHHADCYAENDGCTVFGCSAGPAEEPKLRLTGTDLAHPAAAGVAPTSPTLGLPTTTLPAPSPVRVKTPPPPPSHGTTPAPTPLPAPRFGTGSVLFGSQPVAAVATAAPAAQLIFETDNHEARNRMTFILLGVLLGPFGAHNFYAGYRGKAAAQLCITLLSLGFASPMSWVWAVIDVCTVDCDSRGIKFRS